MANAIDAQLDPNYIALRNRLAIDVEGNKPRIYYDTVGVPTVGIGMALLVNTSTTNPLWILDLTKLNMLE